MDYSERGERCTFGRMPLMAISGSVSQLSDVLFLISVQPILRPVYKFSLRSNYFLENIFPFP